MDREKLLTNDLPAVRLHKIHQKFEKHIKTKYNQVVKLVRDFVEKDESMKDYKQEGVTFYSRKMLKDFHKFLKKNLIES